MILLRFDRSTLKGLPVRIRKQVLERDHYTCQGCLVPQIYIYAPDKRTMFGPSDYCRTNIDLAVHHVIKKPFGSDELSNLKALCRRCHEDVHHDIDPYYTERSLRKVFHKLGMKAIARRRKKSEILRKEGLLSADFDYTTDDIGLPTAAA